MGCYTEAKNDMFLTTDIDEAPWTVIKSDCKKRARLNAIRYVLHKLPYTGKVVPEIGLLDPLLVGRPSEVYESGELRPVRQVGPAGGACAPWPSGTDRTCGASGPCRRRAALAARLGRHVAEDLLDVLPAALPRWPSTRTGLLVRAGSGGACRAQAS